MDSTRPASLWRNTPYALWLTSDTAKQLATAVVVFAIPLIALAVTDDPAQAGIIAAAGMIARLLTTLYGGVLADRHRRIALMLLGAALGVALGAAFTAFAFADALTFPALLAIEILLMIRAGLFEPASESALKEIVPDEAMGRAQAANQGRDAVMNLAGGPLGGALLGAGAWLVGVAMTFGYLVSVATAWVLRRSVRRAGIVDAPATPADRAGALSAGGAPAANAGPRPGGAWAEMREGFVWLFGRPDLSGILLIVTIVNLGFNTGVTTVIYSLQQAGVSELSIGAVASAMGAVMLVGAVVAPMLVARVTAGRLMVTGLAVGTIGIGALAVVEGPWAIAAVLGASVFLLPALNAALMGYFMVATPSALLGRANSAAGVLGMGAMPLAPLIAGFGLSLLGREATILVAAALCAVSVVLAVTNRQLRALPPEAGWAAHAQRFAAASARV